MKIKNFKKKGNFSKKKMKLKQINENKIGVFFQFSVVSFPWYQQFHFHFFHIFHHLFFENFCFQIDVVFYRPHGTFVQKAAT